MDIACNVYDIEDNLDNLTEGMLVNLNLLSPDELFDHWLRWNGIIMYASVIHKVHTEIFKEVANGR